MNKLRVIWHGGNWEVRDGESVVARFASSMDAWAFKRGQEAGLMQRLRQLWRRAA